MTRSLSRTTKYLIVICVFLLAVTASLGYVLTKQTGTALRTAIEYRMLDISNTAAAMLDGDALAVIEAEDADTPAYQSILKTLAYFQDNIDLKYIYCIRDLGGGHFVFTVDPAEDPGEFGEAIVYTDALQRASLGTPAVDKEPYRDRWGRFYSAYSPVFDSNQRVAGIVAVDFSAEWYEQQISHQVRTTLLISGFSLLFAAVMIFLILARYRKQIREILGEMNVVSDGIETLVRELSPGTDVSQRKDVQPAESRDEITELGNRIQSLENQLIEQISIVRSQAYIDGLTGLGNRMAYENRVKELEKEIRSGAAEFAVGIFDVNGLKEINDRYGHEQGDRAIFLLGSVLKKVFAGEELYRIGGDEFIVILKGPDRDLPAAAAEVEKALAKTEGVASAKGYSAFIPGSDTSYSDAFRRADAAMYEDKKKYYMTRGDRRRRG
ncbi:MAG: diguanylate cyclase [Oscillospiraceae bacterium]|nr:diguanylate cyclase [Oscillospiraceae bacterium]